MPPILPSPQQADLVSQRVLVNQQASDYQNNYFSYLLHLPASMGQVCLCMTFARHM